MEDKKHHKPILDQNGKPFSPTQILALERAELTRVRVMRDSTLLAEARDQLIQTDMVTRQAAAIFVAVRQKLLLTPLTLARRLVGKDARAIHDALTMEIHKALHEVPIFTRRSVIRTGIRRMVTATYRRL